MAGRGYSARNRQAKENPLAGVVSHTAALENSCKRFASLILAVAMLGATLVIVLAVTMTSSLVEFVGVLGDRVVHGTAP